MPSAVPSGLRASPLWNELLFWFHVFRFAVLFIVNVSTKHWAWLSELGLIYEAEGGMCHTHLGDLFITCASFLRISSPPQHKTRVMEKLQTTLMSLHTQWKEK